ncbi:translation initiation factor eIF-2B delta subunit [Galdieria sulphuraria]|uniref:Translation initiation factor eIF2B subunit delta n=1 Tax=Galdieria sulphuraria TaxID=130081 RepID=M2X1D9_GALSU|nr:translation initiation factor eIF-2B delta subunit [Galdieria sulphuraria]EME30180.1 translation initiation factor eIF-2B delta subunit [Galdieria sulphuraria]|eukprot:XP_005706700.1 translation initiation factor eIF-2B delta subunit [Galdieria sulphuraria]
METTSETVDNRHLSLLKKKVEKTKHAPPSRRIQYDDPSAVAKLKKTQIVRKKTAERAVPLFSHLPQYEQESIFSRGFQRDASELHPAVIKLGLQYASDVISGASSRCLSLLDTLALVIESFSLSEILETRDYRRELDKYIRRNIQFLTDCRPLSISMGNCIRYIKSRISHLSPSIPEIENKSSLLKTIRSFREEKFERTEEMIAELGAKRIRDGDTILTLGRSSCVEEIFVKAKECGKDFHVIVLEARPRQEGLELCKNLIRVGVKTDYSSLFAASYYMRDVNLVLCGAEGLMSTGAVISGLGTACVALVAKEYHVPVMIASQTIKFSERGHLDAICFNEIGNPEELVDHDGSEWRIGKR